MRDHLRDSLHVAKAHMRDNKTTTRTSLALYGYKASDWDTDDDSVSETSAASFSESSSVGVPLQQRRVRFAPLDTFLHHPPATGSDCSETSKSTNCKVYHNKHQVHEIMNLASYKTSEKKHYWYSPKDMAKMTAEREKVLARLEQGKPCKSATYHTVDEEHPIEGWVIPMSYRGLDCWTYEGSQNLDKRISRVISAVMDEQDRQWQVDDDDSDLIAQISQRETEESVLMAYKIAKQDEEEAKQAWAPAPSKEKPKKRASLKSKRRDSGSSKSKKPSKKVASQKEEVPAKVESPKSTTPSVASRIALRFSRRNSLSKGERNK
eukprot:Nitzschia sp. Nitz4//scaffold139_size61406//47073//48035//NITZ4_006465-RA/size61406-processed-gene-0.71-mRNA-1//1//CDS//3329535867//6203//frame0